MFASYFSHVSFECSHVMYVLSDKTDTLKIGTYLWR